jgi:hypothetical protein
MGYAICGSGGGRLLIAELYGFCLWRRHSDMIGSRTKDVFSMLMDALALSVAIGTKGSVMMMMVAASELYG